MSAVAIILLLVAIQRVGETVYAARNTRALLRRGGVEKGSDHYPLLVLLHAAWLVTLFLLVPADTPISRVWLAVFVGLQVLRIWVLQSLGPYWTTRVITVPGEPLIRRGPYRFLRHPNYVVVAAEIAVLPLVFGAWKIAAVFSFLNLIALILRLRVEERALAQRRHLGIPPGAP